MRIKYNSYKLPFIVVLIRGSTPVVSPDFELSHCDPETEKKRSLSGTLPKKKFCPIVLIIIIIVVVSKKQQRIILAILSPYFMLFEETYTGQFFHEKVLEFSAAIVTKMSTKSRSKLPR